MRLFATKILLQRESEKANAKNLQKKAPQNPGLYIHLSLTHVDSTNSSFLSLPESFCNVCRHQSRTLPDLRC